MQTHLNVPFITRENYNARCEYTFKEAPSMKQRFCLLLAALLLIIALPVHAEEGNFFDSAGKFLGDAWSSVSDAASDAWDAASEAAEDAGEAIGKAWSDVSGFAVDTWNQVGTFLGEKSAEFSVWMSVSGNDALEKLKGIYDETAAEMGIEAKSANDLWLQSMNYADANEIANVTQAKLTLAALAYAQEADAEGDVAQAALDMLLGSGITDQAAADAALASMLAANLEAPDPNEPRYYLGEVVNTGVDNGYSEAREIGDGDVHFGWTLGRFFVCGFTSVYEDENGDPVFIKTLGNQIQLWFELEQDIDCLNGRDALSICEDTNGFDEAFGVSRTNLGRGGHDHAAYGLSERRGRAPTVHRLSLCHHRQRRRTPPCSSLRRATTRWLWIMRSRTSPTNWLPSTAITASPSTSPCATATAWSTPST